MVFLDRSYFSGLVFSKARRLANLESDLSDHQDRNIKKCLGTKAVRLDRYLQRRAWGVYYSIRARIMTSSRTPIAVLKRSEPIMIIATIRTASTKVPIPHFFFMF